MIVDNCWRCGGVAKVEPFGDTDEPRYRVRCQGKCGALGLSSCFARQATTLWNDAQRDERRLLTDTELLKSPPGAKDKLREDSP
jgi:hypothetical protein